MLEAVIADGGLSTVSALARAQGIPSATAHRQIATLVAEGFLSPMGGGKHRPGPRLRAMLGKVDDRQIMAHAAAPLLNRLAIRFGGVAQMGTLENDMVTYRVKTGENAGELFTRVEMQLEAYCSGMGKVLLAYLPAGEREAYLAGGPFVALTPDTITDPADLARELACVARQGYALDRGEIVAGLSCIAVPVHRADGAVVAAISLSRKAPGGAEPRIIKALQDTAQALNRKVFST